MNIGDNLSCTRALVLTIGLTLLCPLATSARAQNLMVWGEDASDQISGAPEGDFKAVAGGAIHGLALRWDRTPVLWGRGPIGPPPIPEELASKKFFDVAIGRDDVVLIRLDGTLAAFGRNAPLSNVIGLVPRLIRAERVGNLAVLFRYPVNFNFMESVGFQFWAFRKGAQGKTNQVPVFVTSPSLLISVFVAANHIRSRSCRRACLDQYANA